MIEAGILKYGEGFLHSMEEGGWDIVQSKYGRPERFTSNLRFRTDE